MRLEVDGVAHRYGALPVLEGIDLAVEDGETLAVLGPSGCGKSTLLGIIGGLLRPTAGEVRVAGPAPPGCLNPLTYVFQDFALLPWRTVRGNVALPLEGRLPAAEVEGRIAEALALVGLADVAHVFPKQLSGGMRQRVGIARALAVHPAVLLLDEPLSALDAQTRELLISEIEAIRARARTTSVWVTHNLDEALRLADRICVLGRRPARIKAIVAVGVPPAERTTPAGASAIRTLHARIWSMIVEEVRAADRELEPIRAA